MDTRDRAFLDDVIQLTHMHHIASAYILRSRLNSEDLLEDVAVFTVGKLRTFPSEEAQGGAPLALLRKWIALLTRKRKEAHHPAAVLADVRANHDAKRIERIICAKLLAELMATCEDLGALGDAIFHRNAPLQLQGQAQTQGQTTGIFRRYLNSMTVQAATFFDQQVLSHNVPNNPNITLDVMLNLPPLTSLAGQLSAEALAALDQSYHGMAQNLHSAAQMYRDRGTQAQAVTGTGPLPSDLEDEVRIILDAVPVGAVSSRRGGLLVRALNKTKHRFMLTERLSQYHDPGAPDTIEYGRFTPAMMDTIVNNTIAVAGTMAEMAAIVQTLDRAGIAL